MDIAEIRELNAYYERIIKDLPKPKSNSQRLRNVLYLIHQKEAIRTPFDEFYNNKMNEIITHFKKKL